MNRTRLVVGAVVVLGVIAILIFGIRGILNQKLTQTNSLPSAVSLNTPTPGAQPSAVAQKPPTKAVVTYPDEDEAIITFATYSFLGDAYQPILEEFHWQYPSITVQIRELPASLDPRQIASSADTVLLMFQGSNSGSYFLDLAPLEEVDPAFEPERFWPGILQACQDAEGRVYGLPLFVEPTGIFYQEKAFDADDLPYPRPGWTWDDFLKAVNTLARTENGLPVYGFADDSFMDSPDETLLSPRISFLLDQTGGEIEIKRFEQELQWYLSLVKSGSLYSENIYPQQSPVIAPQNAESWSKAWNEAWKISHELFLTHPPAMWKGRLDQIFRGNLLLEALPDGSVNMGATSESILKSNLGIGWVPFPISADGQNDRTTPNLVTCAAISAGTGHPRAAWTWLNFLAAHPILPDWSIAVPAQPSAAESSAYWSKIPEKLREPVQFGLQHGWYTNQYPEEVRAVNQALLKAIAQNIDLQAALEEASGQVEAAVLPTPDTAPIVVAPPKPTVVPGDIKINYFSPLSAGNEKIKNLADGFHQLHPDIEVQFASSSSTGGVTELADSFDCFAWLPEENLPVGMLRDLDQALSTEKTDLRDDFTPQALNEFSQDGKLYGLPTAYWPNLIYYNADLLARRGLKPPEVDWTYTDLIELISAAASSSGPEPVYGFALEYPTPDMELFLAGQGARLVDSSGNAPAYLFDTPETRNFVQWLAEQVKSGVIFPVTPLAIGPQAENIMDVRQLILDGRVAFWVSWFDQGQGGSYSLKDASFPIGVATIPLPTSGSITWRPNVVVFGQYISRKAQDPRACWEWIKFLSEQPDNSLGIPARRSVRESDRWISQVGSEAAKVYQAALESRRMLSQESGYSLGQTRDWWNELLAEVINGADPLPLLADLQRKADAYSTCLAASSGYLSESLQQKTQAETDCAVQANQK